MPYASVHSACLSTIGVIPVTVEVDLQPGLPVFSIIGLPDKAVDEARQRVRSAIKNSGYGMPPGKITVNLSPATVRKQGAGLDLAIAIGVLAACGKVRHPEAGVWFLGELSLNGRLVALGQLPALLVEAYRAGVTGCVIPSQRQGSLVGECPTQTARTLQEAAASLSSGLAFAIHTPKPIASNARTTYAIDQVRGQGQAKRALEIALAGGHNLLLTGPPGSGKTMLAQAAAELLPPPEREAELEIIRLQSLANSSYPPGGRPFRAPHHTLSLSALLGGVGGRPGELSLAHGGILFLDELPEFSTEVREALRQPMQEKVVRLNRQGKDWRYPADCLVIGARNGCPCGLLGAEGEICRCLPRDVARYQRALSEPLLERFSLFSEMPKISYAEWSGSEPKQGKEMAERIKTVRAKPVTATVLEQLLAAPLSSLLERAATSFRLSGRALNSIVAVARTIASLEGCEEVALAHLQEALQYRRRAPTSL